MAASSRHEKFAVTFTAGTAISSPSVGSMGFNPGVVQACWVTFPRNCAGFVGVQLQHGGQTIVPWTPSQYLISDDYTYQLDPDGWPNGGAWSLRGYNTDPIYDHTIHVVFGVSEVPASGAGSAPPGAGVQALDLSGLGGGASSSEPSSSEPSAVVVTASTPPVLSSPGNEPVSASAGESPPVEGDEGAAVLASESIELPEGP